MAPAELEGLLLQHPAIEDAAVIGVPDAKTGELPKAYVVLKPQMQATAASITEYVNTQVAPHKKIRAGVEFIDKIPKSEAGKILRRELRNLSSSK